MFKVNTKDLRTWHCSGIFIVNYLIYFTPCSSISIVNFELVIAGWESDLYRDENCRSTRRIPQIYIIFPAKFCIAATLHQDWLKISERPTFWAVIVMEVEQAIKIRWHNGIAIQIFSALNDNSTIKLNFIGYLFVWYCNSYDKSWSCKIKNNSSITHTTIMVLHWNKITNEVSADCYEPCFQQ